MKKQGRYLINEVMVVENGNILEVVKGSEKEIVLNDTLQEHIMCALMNIDMEELKEIDWLVKVRFEDVNQAYNGSLIKDTDGNVLGAKRLMINGEAYVPTKPTPSETRQCKMMYIKESVYGTYQLYENLVSRGWIRGFQASAPYNEDINLMKEVVSRFGLFRSNGFLTSIEPTYLVIEDKEYFNLQKVRTFDNLDLEVGDDVVSVIKEENLKSTHNDGGGIIHPNMMARIAKDLGIDDYVPCFVGVRSIKHCLKGALVSVDFVQYFKDNYTGDTEHFEKRADGFYAKDIFEEWIKIDDTVIIVPESMTKWCKLKSKGFDKVDERFRHLTETLFITKVSKKRTTKQKTTSYQLMNNLALDEETYEGLAKPTYEYLENVLKFNMDDVHHFLGNVISMSSEYKERIELEEEVEIDDSIEKDIEDLNKMGIELEDKYALLLSVNPDFINTPFVKRTITTMVERKIKELQSAKFIVESDFKTLTQEPLGLLDWVMKRDKNIDYYGSLEAGEFWCNTNKEKALVCRFPIASFSEVQLMNFVKNDMYRRYCSHWTDELLVFNAKDITAKILSGADFDLDTAQCIYEESLFDCIVPAQDGIPFISTRAEKAPANKVEYNFSNLMTTNTKYMGNIIGRVALLGCCITNKLSSTAGSAEETREAIKQRFYEKQDTIYKIVEISMLAVDQAKRGELVELDYIDKVEKEYSKPYFAKFLPDKDYKNCSDEVVSAIDKYAEMVKTTLGVTLEENKKRFGVGGSNEFIQLFDPALRFDVPTEIYDEIYEKIDRCYYSYLDSMVTYNQWDIYKIDVELTKKRLGGVVYIGDENGEKIVDTLKVARKAHFKKEIYSKIEAVALELQEKFDKEAVCRVILGFMSEQFNNNNQAQRFIFEHFFTYVETMVYHTYKVGNFLEKSILEEDTTILDNKYKRVKCAIKNSMIGELDLDKFASRRNLSLKGEQIRIGFSREISMNIQFKEIKLVVDENNGVVVVCDGKCLGKVIARYVSEYNLTNLRFDSKFKVIADGDKMVGKNGKPLASYTVTLEGI